jgi:hypothetical protein
MAASADGNQLYIGTASGSIYRITGLNQVIDSINGDVDSSTVANPNCVLTCNKIGASSGRAITGIAVDPGNADKIVVTVGNYGSTDHVYYCGTATTVLSSSTMSNFSVKTGNLPAMPVYGAIIDMSDDKKVVIGTEYGVYGTDDITAGSPVWISQNATMSNAAVFRIRQQQHQTWTNQGWGDLYLGTHGRGMWKSTSLSVTPTGFNDPITGGTHGLKPQVSVFPSPASSTANIRFFNPGKGKVMMEMYDVRGTKVRTEHYGLLNTGSFTFTVNVSDLPAGTYFVNVTSEAQNAVGKFVISR